MTPHHAWRVHQESLTVLELLLIHCQLKSWRADVSQCVKLKYTCIWSLAHHMTLNSHKFTSLLTETCAVTLVAIQSTIAVR